MFVSFLVGAIRIGAIFLFGSTGEIITEKSGHINLGVPGVMSVGTAVGCLSEYYLIKSIGTSVPFLLVLVPLIVTFLAGAAMGALYSFLTVTLRANQNVTGLAMTTFGVGLAGHLINLIKAKMAVIARASKYYTNLFPVGDKLGWFGEIFLSHGIFVYLAIIVAIAAQLILNRTRIGLHLRAVGENSATADAAGINVSRYKYWATCIGCGRIMRYYGLYGRKLGRRTLPRRVRLAVYRPRHLYPLASRARYFGLDHFRRIVYRF